MYKLRRILVALKKHKVFGFVVAFLVLAYCLIVFQSEENQEIKHDYFVYLRSISQSRNKTLWKGGNVDLNHDMKFPLPKYSMGRIFQNVDILMGITTTERSKYSYLLKTIQTLLSLRGTSRTFGILIYVGETNNYYVTQTCHELWNAFAYEIILGQIQVISPPKFYYPNWSKSLEENLGDNLKRVKWRSKQNLDIMFLMWYAYTQSPKYFLMLEDDIFPSKNYLNSVFNRIHFHSKQNNSKWFLLSFSRLGFIGKLFRTSTLPPFIHFVSLFWNKKPIDWLLRDFVSVAYCSHDVSFKICQKIIKKFCPFVRPALFQHVGMYSSLHGKKQKLKEKSFHRAYGELKN